MVKYLNALITYYSTKSVMEILSTDKVTSMKQIRWNSDNQYKKEMAIN
jgi:hypothetical protein